jgi:phosphatidate cytidylyltransferase
LVLGNYINETLAPAFAIICAAGSFISIFGDLAASAIKRNYDVKDYSNLIPGHGGILDRFDSMIFTAPVIYYLGLLLL